MQNLKMKKIKQISIKHYLRANYFKHYKDASLFSLFYNEWLYTQGYE